MRTLIQNHVTDAERALYHLESAKLTDCRFEGPADGESALKEARDVELEHCRFALRYPLWHTDRFSLTDCEQTETCRAAMWYSGNGVLERCTLSGIKALRECDTVRLAHCKVSSQEFGWRCRDLTLEDTEIHSEYALLESKEITAQNLRLTGKYSFQYTENVHLDNAELNTKDAFWHAKNVVVRDSIINGEYLGWYSEGLTLIRCRIIGTQPFCYCKNLTLTDCTMEQTDLAFEYSDVNAEILGSVLSVKNPRSGSILADGFGEIILRDAVYPCDCEIRKRND